MVFYIHIRLIFEVRPNQVSVVDFSLSLDNEQVVTSDRLFIHLLVQWLGFNIF